MRKVVIYFTLFLLPIRAIAQTQENTVLFYNVGFGAVTAAIGAVINKPKHTNWKRPFINGLWQGSIGGLLNYTSKKTLYLINKEENMAYGWPAKLLHSAGYSIIENAAYGRPFLHYWNIDYGPVRLDFCIHNRKALKARLLPEFIYSVYQSSLDGGFDLRASLLTGNIAFVNNNFYIKTNSGGVTGRSYGRSFSYVNNYPHLKYAVIAHELVHQFQYNEYQVLNTWLTPLIPANGYKNIKNIFSNYIYFDFPYFSLFYEAYGQYGPAHHYRNFYEFEAQRFATNQFVVR